MQISGCVPRDWTAKVREALLKRISMAVMLLQIGLPLSRIKSAPLAAINRALTLVGSPRIPNLEVPALSRAVLALEGALE